MVCTNNSMESLNIWYGGETVILKVIALNISGIYLNFYYKLELNIIHKNCILINYLLEVTIGS